MKHINKLLFTITALIVLVSCAEKYESGYKPTKPEEVELAEYLNSYGVLKSYINKTTDPNFKLGAGVMVNEFLKKELAYSLICYNFDEISANSAMTYGSVVKNDGSMDFSTIKNFIETAKNVGITVYGHTLVSDSMQNGTYLNGIIAPIPGGIIRTPEEKKEILTNALDTWIHGMMEACDDNVTSWDVVNEPMDNDNPYELKTGVGKVLASNEFYWQDYLGKDYAVNAFKLAKQYGNANDKLFINDNNLEYNLDKCKGLIDYVAYIESKGAQVDGIGTQMHINTNSDTVKIAEMFTLLAATGKLIKISELDVRIGNGVITDSVKADDYKAQAKMYKYVAKKYFELVPAQQRYGITVWSPQDSNNGSSWLPNEPIGLWTTGCIRKLAYAGFADGLQ